jgi:hypothetical protein
MRIVCASGANDSRFSEELVRSVRMDDIMILCVE